MGNFDHDTTTLIINRAWWARIKFTLISRNLQLLLPINDRPRSAAEWNRNENHFTVSFFVGPFLILVKEKINNWAALIIKCDCDLCYTFAITITRRLSANRRTKGIFLPSDPNPGNNSFPFLSIWETQKKSPLSNNQKMNLLLDSPQSSI